jgi:hypothetical protein
LLLRQNPCDLQPGRPHAVNPLHFADVSEDQNNAETEEIHEKEVDVSIDPPIENSEKPAVTVPQLFDGLKFGLYEKKKKEPKEEKKGVLESLKSLVSRLFSSSEKDKKREEGDGLRENSDPFGNVTASAQAHVPQLLSSVRNTVYSSTIQEKTEDKLEKTQNTCEVCFECKYVPLI